MSSKHDIHQTLSIAQGQYSLKSKLNKIGRLFLENDRNKSHQNPHLKCIRTCIAVMSRWTSLDRFRICTSSLTSKYIYTRSIICCYIMICVPFVLINISTWTVEATRAEERSTLCELLQTSWGAEFLEFKTLPFQLKVVTHFVGVPRQVSWSP